MKKLLFALFVIIALCTPASAQVQDVIVNGNGTITQPTNFWSANPVPFSSISAGLGNRTISTTSPLSGGGALSSNLTLTVGNATASATGVVELATDAETQTGTDTDRPVPVSARAAWWTWVKTLAQTFTGDFTAGDAAGDQFVVNDDDPRAPNLTAATYTSAADSSVLLNGNVADARFARFFLGAVETAETVTNNATFTASSAATIDLPVGIYFVESLELVVGQTSTCASKTELNFTGTATASSVFVTRGFSTSADLANIGHSYDGGAYAYNSFVASNFGGNRGCIVNRKFLFNVTVSGALRIRFAQAVATPGETATLKVGSYVSAIKK